MYPYFSNSKEAEEDKTNILEIKTNFSCSKDLDDMYDDKDLDDMYDDDKTEEDLKSHIIESIKEAILDKNRNIDYYDRLSKKITDDKDRAILRNIYLDEKKHKSIFEKLYKLLTGLDAKFDKIEDAIDTDDSLAEQFLERIEDKFENIEFFRMLMSIFSDLPIRDLIYKVILDEQKHTQQLSNLYNKYK